MKPDKTGHWPSRDPRTGLLLKGRSHPTWHLTVKGERKAGYEIYKGKDEDTTQKRKHPYRNIKKKEIMGLE